MRLELITLRNKKDDLEVNLQEKKSGSGFNKLLVRERGLLKPFAFIKGI